MPIIQSVERALQILDLFNEQATELKITDISKLMGLSKSTLHSLLKTCSFTAISIRTRRTVNIASA
jgi:predicted transcriptional regulator